MDKEKSAFLSAFSHGNTHNLTETETEVLYYLTKEFLTSKQISIRRKTKIRTVQNIIKKLKEKGIINNAFQEVRNSIPTNALFEKHNHLIRLHGEEYHILILYKDDKYKQILNKCNFIDFDGNTIRLSKDSIEIYSGKSFFADTVDKATLKSIDYFNTLFYKLENELKIILKKPKVQNIKRVNAHYSEVGNELSEQAEQEGKKIRLYTRDDGKLWFIIDNSFNLHEAETVHPQTSKDDMTLVKSFFDDVRMGTWETLKYNDSAILQVLGEYSKNIVLHLEVMNNINKGQEKQNEVLEQMSETLKNLNDSVKKTRQEKVRELLKEYGW